MAKLNFKYPLLQSSVSVCTLFTDPFKASFQNKVINLSDQSPYSASESSHTLSLSMYFHRSHKNNIPELTVHSNSAMKCQQEYKSRLKAKFQCIHNDMSKQSHPTFLNDIFTELYITEGESQNVNKEHEVRQIETALRRKTTVDIPVKCNDIFKHLSEENRPIKCVLTKGVAGIGKQFQCRNSYWIGLRAALIRI